MPPISDLFPTDDKYRILLQVSEAASGELNAVLEAVGRVVHPIVTVDAVAVVTVDGDELRPHAIHVAGVERRRGESFAEAASRGLRVPAGNLSAKQLYEVDRLLSDAFASSREIEIDLSRISVIDRGALRYFVSGQGRLATIVACPSYVREWMRCEARHEDERA